MSSPARRPSSRPTRRQREARAYRLTLAAGATGVAAAVSFVLALITAFAWTWFVLLAVVTVALGFMVKRSVGA